MTLGRTASRIFPATVLGLALVSCSGSPSEVAVVSFRMREGVHTRDRLRLIWCSDRIIPQRFPLSRKD